MRLLPFILYIMMTADGYTTDRCLWTADKKFKGVEGKNLQA